MGSEGRETVRSPQAEYRCPACGEPVGTVIKRRKTLGAFVPTWEPGPCRNSRCALSPEYQGEEPADKSGGEPGAEPGGEPGAEPGKAVGTA
ncbi:hypothetical protein AB0F96_16670 [Streptomyces sp. NPDC023998]|uniref:hypothetical protein n=1 Tax=Streptomyces sp. NPDC023998 TaxID=3154597 RepID=UPI0033E69290